MPRDKTLVPPVVRELSTGACSYYFLFIIIGLQASRYSRFEAPAFGRFARTLRYCYMDSASKSHVRYRLFFFAFVTYNGPELFENLYRYFVFLIVNNTTK